MLPCILAPQLDSWVIGLPGQSCESRCSDYSMSCSAPEMWGLDTKETLLSTVGDAIPLVTCSGDLALSPSTAAPALDPLANTCAVPANGVKSECRVVPPPEVMRVCYCRARCPALPQPPTGTLLEYYLLGERVVPERSMVPSGTQARYRCAPGKTFRSHEVRGSFQVRGGKGGNSAGCDGRASDRESLKWARL